MCHRHIFLPVVLNIIIHKEFTITKNIYPICLRISGGLGVIISTRQLQRQYHDNWDFFIRH